MNHEANLLSYRARIDRKGPVAGHLTRWWDEKDADGKPIPGKSRLVTLLGDQIDKKISPGFQTIDIDDPKLKMKLNGVHAELGTYLLPAGSKKPILQPLAEDDQNWYVLLASGLILREAQSLDPRTGRRKFALSTEPDLHDLRRRGINLEPHGFHPLGGARSLLASEAGIDFHGEESKRLWSAIGRERLRNLDDTPQYRYDLVSIPKNGGEGVHRDFGVFVHMVGTPTELKVNATSDPKYRKYWDLAEEKRGQDATARREARRLQNLAKPEQPEAAQTESVTPPQVIEAQPAIEQGAEPARKGFFGR